MISLRLTRWFLGYVRFSVLGGSPERFYTNCARSGAYLWDIASGEHAGACVVARRYHFLRRSARRAGARLRVRTRVGLPFSLRKTRGHAGLWAGGAAFLAIFFALSVRVWCIQVTGNLNVPSEQIERALASAGLVPGALRSSVNPQAVERHVMLQCPGIRWISVNLRGSAAEAAVQEATQKPGIADQKSVCNVVAARTGQIISLRVFAGTAEVKKGDAVMEGQLLVNAVVEDQTGASTLMHASAEIIAETSREITVKIPLRRQEDVPTGRTVVRRNLDLFGAHLPLMLQRKPQGPWRCEAVRTTVSLFGTPLPLGVYTENWEEIRTGETVLTQAEARAAAGRQIDAQTTALLKGAGRVTGRSLTEHWSKDALVCEAKLSCEENIAKESEISIK